MLLSSVLIIGVTAILQPIAGHPSYSYQQEGGRRTAPIVENFTTSDGSVYIGALNDHGQAHGKGVFKKYANGDEYDGEWKDDAAHGKGVKSWFGSFIVCEGKWRNGSIKMREATCTCWLPILQWSVVRARLEALAPILCPIMLGLSLLGLTLLGL